MNIRQEKLPIAALERIDDHCAEFERQWQAGLPPAIESFLGNDLSSIERDVLLAELIVLDIDYRRRRGESPNEQEYVGRFPECARVVSEILRAGDKSQGAFAPPSTGRLAELFPKLEIIELIGAGGMGAVYKARQTGLDRLVALKILPEEFSYDVKFSLRFTREARTLAKLQHPNIVSVYEFGRVEDTCYFLMEFVDGTTLRDLVKAGELSPEHALEIVPCICDALQYAHDSGVIHRDIKPENILVAKNGKIKIADFGLSRILGTERQEFLTATHQVMGTPRYMAPENLEGSRGVDHRADIYSLGVVFYELLTGELPVGRFAAPSTKVEIDVRLDEVVLRTLEKEPQRRYQAASQIKSDIQMIASDSDPAFAPTQANAATRMSDANPNLAEQELAGRLLLTRSQLMDRVQKALHPLIRGQFIQIFIGVALIAVGAQCWARNLLVAHRLACGLILHVYGIVVISQAALVITRIKRVDTSRPIEEIRENLHRVRGAYLFAGAVIGFAWWLMWIPLCVAIGFDAVVVYWPSLMPSLVIGVAGLSISLTLYWWALRKGNEDAESWRQRLSGESISKAILALEEIERAKIS